MLSMWEVPGLPLGAWVLDLSFVCHGPDPRYFFKGLLIHIPTLVMHPPLYSMVHRVISTLARGPFNHGFVR